MRKGEEDGNDVVQTRPCRTFLLPDPGVWAPGLGSELTGADWGFAVTRL